MATSYTGTSIVDYLKSTGGASDYASRSTLATSKGITGYQGTAAQNTQLLNMLRGAGGTTPTGTGTGGSITSGNLQQGTNVNLPTTTPASTYGGIQGATEGIVQQSQAEKDLASTKSAKDTSLQDYMASLVEQGGINASQDRSEQDAAKKKYDAFTSQLEQEQLGMRRQIEAITGSGALTQEQAAPQIQAVSRSSLSKQADIAILQSASARDYETAASIADRQVALKLEQSKIKVEVLKTFYEANKATFDKADERLYNAKLKEEERAYKKQEELETGIRDIKMMALQNDAPANVITALSGAKTIDEAQNIAGKYGTNYLETQLKKLQIQKAKQDLTKGTGDGIKTQVIDLKGKKVLINSNTGAIIKEFAEGEGDNAGTIVLLQDKISTIDNLISHKGLSNAVGTTVFGRMAPFQVGQKQDFIAGVQQLVSRDTLDTLINLKKAGGTLGALSDQERIMLQSAASKIGTWAKVNNKGKVVGYKASESSFKKELETIKKLSQRAMEEASGTNFALDSYLDSVNSALQITNSPYSIYLNQ